MKNLFHRPTLATPLLLVVSNVFMTLAWYGHLKFEKAPVWLAIGGSWLLAFFEYCFQVPANRLGSQSFSVTQLKIMQECITLFVFSIVAYLMFGQRLTWNNAIAYGLVVAAVYFSFRDGEQKTLELSSTASDEKFARSETHD